MKKFLLIILVSISLISLSQEEINFNKIPCCHKSSFSVNRFTQSQIGNTYNQNYLRAVWYINPEQYYISGNVTYYFTMTESSNIMTFDLHDTLTVDSIIFNTNQLSYTRNNHFLEITLPSVINQGTNDSISIFYKGVPTKVDSTRGTFAMKKYEYNGDSIPCLWTLSEPYGAKDWFPCKQELYDKIDSCDLFFITPNQYKTAANGLLISEDTANGKRTSHWKHKHPIATYLIGFVSSKFIENHRYIHLLNNDSLYFMEYSLINDSSAVQTPYNLDILFNFYDTLFIPYPFMDEKYGHMQWKRAGGMEHQTISSMRSLNWHDMYVIEHELAHQWFGDFITCGSWQDIWLNEGFAIFGNFVSLEYLWTYYPDWHSNLIRSYHNDIIRLPDGSVFVDDTTSVNRIFSGRLTYEKGGFLLRMLRWELGDTDFFNAVRAYLNDTDLQNGYARTSDLVEKFEQEADTNLTEFFNDWFYGEGYPIYNVEYDQSTDFLTDILIKQTTSHSSVSFYEMTVPIQFWINGNDTIVKFHNTTNNQLFSAQLNGIIDSVKFDPYYKIISENNVSQNINLIDNSKKISVYPNPAKDEITISLGKLPLQINNIYITDINGKQTNLDFRNTNTQKINISNITSGTYIITVETSSFNFNKKILINP